jgi:hypothetical protein
MMVEKPWLVFVPQTLAPLSGIDISFSECFVQLSVQLFRFVSCYRNIQEVMEIDEHLLARFSRISEDSDVASDRGSTVRSRSPTHRRHDDRLQSSRRHTSHDDREGRSQRRTEAHVDAIPRASSSSAHGRHPGLRQPSPSSLSNLSQV